jgi:two-component system sensor histidine kinase UhpB
MKRSSKTKSQLLQEIVALRRRLDETEKKPKVSEGSMPTEDPLRASEERFRNMFEGHKAVMLLIEPESGEIVDANVAAAAFYGYSREQLRSLRIQDINQLAPDEVAAERRNALEEKQDYFIFPHRLADGQLRWVEVYSSPIEVRGQHLLFSVIHDISERKRAEESLRESVERFRVAITGSPITVYQHDKDLRFTWVYNPPPGFSAEDFLGKTIEEAYTAEDAVRLIKLKRQVLDSGVGMRGETWFTAKGELHFVDCSIEPLRDESGQIAGITCATVDITERKRAEEALRASEEQYRRFFELGAIGMCETDPATGRLLRVNDRHCEITGYSREEMLGKTMRDLAHPEDREADWEKFTRMVRGEAPEYSNEKRYIRRDGQVIWVRAAARVIRDENGNPVRTVGVLMDITERKRAEERLRNINEELERVVAKRTEELRRLSAKLLAAQEEERSRIALEIHDGFGASLSAAKYRMEDAIRQGGGDRRLEAVTSILQGAIEESRRLQMSLRPAMLDDLGLLPTLGWLCRETEKSYPELRIEKQLEVEEHRTPDSVKTQVFRIVQEALHNVAKHSGATLVHLCLREAGGRLELILRDNGQGFDVEEAYAREVTVRGLGLVSMRERVELSGGAFSVESRPGEGTAIRAGWPLQRDEAK